MAGGGGSNGGSGGFSAPRAEREKSRSSAGRATTTSAAAAATTSTPEPSSRPNEGVEPGLVRAYATPVSMYAKLNGKWKQKPIFLRRNLSYCRQARGLAREYKQAADASSDTPKVDITVTVALARCTDEQAQANLPLNARTYSSLSEDPQEMSVLVAVVDPSPTAAPVSRARCLSVPFTCGEASTSGRSEGKEFPSAFFPWLGTPQDRVASTFELLFIVWEAHPDLRCLKRPQGAPISAETMALGSIPVNSTVSYASVPLRSVLPPKAVTKHTVVMRLIQLSRGVLRKRSIRGIAQLYVEPLPQGQSSIFLKVHADISSPSLMLIGDVSSKTHAQESGELLFTYMFDENRKRIEVVYQYQCPFCCLKCGSVIGLSLHVVASHDLFQYSSPFDTRASRIPQIIVQPRPEVYDADGHFIGEKPLDYEWTIVAKSFYFMSRPKTWAGWLRLLTELWGNCNMSLLSSSSSTNATGGGKANSRPGADVSEVTELASHPSSSNSAPILQPNNNNNIVDERDTKMFTAAEAPNMTHSAGRFTPPPSRVETPLPTHEMSVEEEKEDKVSSKSFKSKAKSTSLSTREMTVEEKEDKVSSKSSKSKAAKFKAASVDEKEGDKTSSKSFKSKSKAASIEEKEDKASSLKPPKFKSKLKGQAAKSKSQSRDVNKSVGVSTSKDVSTSRDASKSINMSQSMDVSNVGDMSKSIDMLKSRDKSPLTIPAVTSKHLMVGEQPLIDDDNAAAASQLSCQPSSAQPPVGMQQQQQAEEEKGGVEAVKAEKRPAKQTASLSAQAREALSARRFYHSRTAQLMTLEEVLSDKDSDDELDEEQAEADDRRMLESFKHLAVHEKDFMSMWNTFRRKHPVYGDRDMPKVCEQFAREHTIKFAEQPELRSVFVQLLIHLWDISVLESVHVDSCLRLADGVTI